jgi:hypothetical protein
MRRTIPKWLIVLLVVTVFAILMTWNIKMDWYFMMAIH